MIRNTFSILNGIGEKLERRLWMEGILTWTDFIAANNIRCISPERKAAFDWSLSTAERKLGEGDAVFFARNVRRREHWRLFEIFGKDAVYLDIETNGLPPGRGGYVTVVGFYDGYDWRCLVEGDDLTSENLRRALSGYKCLVTFYGSSFDVPFLQRSFPDVRFDIPHFDLCFAAKRLGIKGGLKRIEELFEIERDHDVKGMNGYDAVKLWELAKRGSGEARRLLLCYNREDTINLSKIADILYHRLRQSTGIEEHLVCGLT
ncbi:MAG TPA: ribonuclease H-like domain-containing protein [Thermodesulfovibrionales bacterium]|nr:ribonuclease H-like domain-containing protein [Thermodesulfovibrionales bacterium]